MTDTPLFIYLSFEDTRAIEAAQELARNNLPDIFYEPVTENFHCTLLWLPDVDEAAERYLIDHCGEWPSMSIGMVEIGTFPSPASEDRPLIVRLRTEEPLMYLQRFLHSLAMELRLDVSPFSRPEAYQPHVTLAYGVEEEIDPFPVQGTLIPTSILLARDNYQVVGQIPLSEELARRMWARQGRPDGGEAIGHVGDE